MMVMTDRHREKWIAAYFERLGLEYNPGQLQCTGQLLRELQYAHVTHIPYENLDILLGIDLPTAYPDQYEKIITNHRGGYCFELNGLFAGLLRELGFAVVTYMGRYLRGESDIPMRRHRVIRTECADGVYICDAGVGQIAPRYPLVLKSDLIQEQFNETYKIEKEPFLGWVIYDRHEGQWQKFYSFTEEEQLDIDFVMPSFYCEKSEDSVFNKSIMLSIKTAVGRKTLDGKLFRIYTPGKKDERTIESIEDLRTVISKEFLINCPLLPTRLLQA